MTTYSEEIRILLEEKTAQYNRPGFIETDPVYVPHQFSRKEDIEIAGFLSATIAWGNRLSILKSALLLMRLMDYAPYDFVTNHQEGDLHVFDHFVHRTFQAEDAKYFMRALRHIYLEQGGLEKVFSGYATSSSIIPAIEALHRIFFSLAHPARSRKHLSDPAKGSAAKRVNLFLRWMVRNDNKGVDFGLWRSLSPAILSCPLDVHSAAVARKLGLLHRKQNDIKAVRELDTALRAFDPDDPVKYDFALFGLGIFEKFSDKWPGSA